MPSPTEALAALRRDESVLVASLNDDGLDGSIVSRLLAIAEAAAALSEDGESQEGGWGPDITMLIPLRAALASLTSEETPAPETDEDAYGDCTIWRQHGDCHCSTGATFGTCGRVAAAAAPTRADDRCPPAEQGERENPDASSHVADSRAASIDQAAAAAPEESGEET